MNLYGFVGNNGISQWDFLGREANGKAHKIKLSPKETRLQIGKCGAFRYDFDWKVEPSKGTKGFILQKVTIKARTYKCGTFGDEPFMKKGEIVGIVDDSFYEAWAYPGGKGGNQDTWKMNDVAMRMGEKCKGSLELTATAYFVEQGKLDGFHKPKPIKYPDEPTDDDPFVSSGDPPANADLVIDHNINNDKYVPPTSSSNTVTTTLKATWNCCEGLSDTDVSINGKKRKPLGK